MAEVGISFFAQSMLPSAVFVKEKFQKEIGLVLTVQAKVPTTQNVHREVEADTQDQTSKLTTCLFDYIREHSY